MYFYVQKICFNLCARRSYKQLTEGSQCNAALLVRQNWILFSRELTGAATVVGLRSDDNRKFFREDSLTLQKVTDICRAVETAQEQIQILSEDHVVKCIRRDYKRWKCKGKMYGRTVYCLLQRKTTAQKSGLEEASSVRTTGDTRRVKTWYSVSNTFVFIYESGSSDQIKTHSGRFWFWERSTSGKTLFLASHLNVSESLQEQPLPTCFIYSCLKYCQKCSQHFHIPN